MRKLALTLILVLSISLITFKAFTGNLEPSDDPGPTMHTLNEIYDQIVQNAVPRYEYEYFSVLGEHGETTIHNGSGVVHSIIFGGSTDNGALWLADGSKTICWLRNINSGYENYSPRVITLDISYKNSLKLHYNIASGVTVVYKPDN